MHEFRHPSGQFVISHRVPFVEVGRSTVTEIVLLAPRSSDGGDDQVQCKEYIEYFGSKQRSGVARIENSCFDLHVVPPDSVNATCLLTSAVEKQLKVVQLYGDAALG